MTLREVPLGRIDLRDRRFSFSRCGGTERLERSIARTGLLSPPDLFASGSSYAVIRGRRRIEALRRLGHRRLEARVFEESEVTPLEAWSMNFYDTVGRRDLNAAERCTAVLQLVDLGLAVETVVKEYLPLLGLPPTGETALQCARIASFPERILDAMAEGSVTFASAVFLASLPGGDRSAAGRFLLNYRLTFSQQKEWSRLAADISAREGVSVAAVLRAASRSARRHGGPPGAAALQALRERRHPAVAATRRAHRDLLRRLRLPGTVQLEHHPFFERSGVTVRFSARDRKSFEDSLRHLERVAADPALERILDPAGDD